MKRIPSSRRKRSINAKELLNEALDDKCQGRKFLKCEGQKGNSTIYRQRRLASEMTWSARKDHVASFLKDKMPWLTNWTTCHAPNPKGSKAWETHPKDTCRFFLLGKSNYRRSLFSFHFHRIRIYNHKSPHYKSELYNTFTNNS